MPTVKRGGGNVKVWECFAWSGIGNLTFIDGNMTGYMYEDILENNLLQSTVKLNLGKNIIFQHDNDPKHTAHFDMNWLNKQRIELATIFTRYEFN